MLIDEHTWYDIIEKNETENIKLHIQNGADIHYYRNHLLKRIMMSKNYDLLRWVIRYSNEKIKNKKNFMSLSEEFKYRILRYAISINDYEILAFVLEIGVDKRKGVEDAILNKNLEVLEYFVKYGIDIKHAFTYSIAINNIDLIKYFLEKGAIIDNDAGIGLSIASENNNIDIMNYLIEKGAIVSAGNNIAMNSAAENGRLEAIELLIKHGADIHLNGDKSMLLAIKNKHTNVIKFFIENGMNPLVIDKIPTIVKKEYPIIEDMIKHEISNIFEYTVFLAKNIYPTLKGAKKEKTLQLLAELSSLPYIKNRSQNI
jgi:ankyrin repeat protein